MGAKYTKAQANASKKYDDKMDIIRIRVLKGKKEEYKAIADAEGKSLNQYIVDRIEGVK